MSAKASATTSTDILLEHHRMYKFGFQYGQLVYRLRWIITLIWLIGLAVSIPFASKIGNVLTGGGYSFSGSESIHAQNLYQQKLHQPLTEVLAVFQSDTTPVSDPGFQKEINDFSQKAKAAQNVSEVTNAGVGKDGKTDLVVVDFNKDPDYMQQHFDSFKSIAPTGSAASPAKVYLTGDLAVYSEFDNISTKDTEQADGLALPIALIILLIVFGTLIAAATPILLALIAVPVALAVIYAIALHSPTSITVLNVATIVGFGISIDYSLFMVRRFRDELASRRSVQDAIGWTVATSGEAILFSGLTVIIGFTGMLLIGIQFMTSFGIGGAIVVLFSVLAALTFLPAWLSILGSKINLLRIPFINTIKSFLVKPSQDEDGEHGFWHGVAMSVMRRPVFFLLGVVIILMLLGWPIFSIQIGDPGSGSLPASSQARQGIDILDAQYPSLNQNPIYIIAQTSDGSSIFTKDNLDKLDQLTQWIVTVPHVTSVSSITRLPAQTGVAAISDQQLKYLISSGAYQANPALKQYVSTNAADDTALIMANTDTQPESSAGNHLIDALRSGIKGQSDGLNVFVGGSQAVTLDFDRYLYDHFPITILYIMVATFVLLLIMFRSLLLPLKAVLVNVLSISASYGVLVYGFQWGNFAGILNFKSEGFIESVIPILMFCILFGLSMDYEVFLLSRIQEEWLRTGDNTRAVARGLEKTGGVITNAALLFMIVAGAITFTSIISTKEIGLGMTVAVFVDASIIRVLLVPAAMRLLGRWNWWLPGYPLPPKQPVVSM